MAVVALIEMTSIDPLDAVSWLRKNGSVGPSSSGRCWFSPALFLVKLVVSIFFNFHPYLGEDFHFD